MGCKESKNIFRPDLFPEKHRTFKQKPLNKVDMHYLTHNSGLTHDEMEKILKHYHANNGAGLQKWEFIELYASLRLESIERLEKISEFVFNAFDTDHNHLISLKEFVIGYVLTNRGTLDKKLEYAFQLYDSNNDGFLDINEVKNVVEGMIILISGKNSNVDVNAVSKECLKELDVSNDGRISKNEFIQGLQKSYLLRTLMSPFN